MDKKKKNIANRFGSLTVNGLIGKLLFLLARSAVAGIVFFFVLNACAETGLEHFFLRSGYLEQAEKNSLQNLQAYISKNKLKGDNRAALSRWMKKQPLAYLEIYRDGSLLYDSNADEAGEEYEPPTYDQTEFYYQGSHYILTFSDGEAEVFLLGAFDYQLYTYALVAELLTAFLLFLLLFISGIRYVIRYIQTLQDEIRIMEGGCLDHEILIKGNDELADLARGLEQLRISLKENLRNESILRQTNQSLITGITHDLRTPLTALTMYTQILQSGTCEEEKQQYYLEKIMTKATLMKDLSDRLFEYSQVKESTDDKPLFEIKTFQDAFMDCLSEMVMYLDNQGFPFQTELDWRTASIEVRMDYIARIIDNISGNLLKYADPNSPIRLKTIYQNHMAGIQLDNRIRKQDASIESTKVGITNVKHMVEQMNGLCQIEIEQETYQIRLLFPVLS